MWTLYIGLTIELSSLLISVMNNFTNDLAEAKETEARVAEIFWAQWVDWFFKEYDLKVEVKKDLLYHRTGNVAIEIRYKWEPSWRIDWADVLVYEIEQSLRVCKTQSIKAYLKQCTDRYKLIRWGDNNKSLIALVPLDDFKYMFKKIIEPR